MKTILVINGETYWQNFLPTYKVEQKKIQTSEWILKEGELYVIDAQSVVKPDLILWRVGAIRPSNKQRYALDLIQLAKIPCINAVEVLQKGYDRLSMLANLQKCELPIIPFNAATSSLQLKNIALKFPFVVKAGNYHGGFGKVLVENAAKWQDIQDILFISEEYVTIEPYIDYERDIRYLAIGDKMWAMARKGKFWKANVETTDFQIIDMDLKLVSQTKKLQDFLQADILAVDILQDKQGNYFFVEYNDIPGLSGFSDDTRYKLAEIVQYKLK
jgi:ribosomal protein S6--L-glutamate ligase